MPRECDQTDTHTEYDAHVASTAGRRRVAAKFRARRGRRACPSFAPPDGGALSAPCVGVGGLLEVLPPVLMLAARPLGRPGA